MAKKVVFIGGTSYSGSTLLDMMLSNADNGFSCGEVHALFRPYRPHHVNPKCVCGASNCDIWKRLRKYGERRLYVGIFKEMPHLEFIVDSSKDSLWIKDQTLNLDESNIEIHNILIWKTPLEFAFSCFKRGILDKWERSWINYHKRYFSSIEKWYSVRYQNLAKDPSEKLKTLCDLIGIEYFSGKENYWEKTHHTLFGNYSAKIHLHNRNSNIYSQHEAYLKRRKRRFSNTQLLEITHHKSIYYEEGAKNPLPSDIKEKSLNSHTFDKIIKILESSEVNHYQWDENLISRKEGFRHGPFPFWHLISRCQSKCKSFRLCLNVKG